MPDPLRLFAICLTAVALGLSAAASAEEAEETAAPEPTPVWGLHETPEGAVISLGGCEHCDDIWMLMRCDDALGIITLSAYNFTNVAAGNDPLSDNDRRVLTVRVDGRDHQRTAILNYMVMDDTFIAESILNRDDPLINAIGDGARLQFRLGEDTGNPDEIPLGDARVHVDELLYSCIERSKQIPAADSP